MSSIYSTKLRTRGRGQSYRLKSLVRKVVCALAVSLCRGPGPATAAESPTFSDLVSRIPGQTSVLVQSSQRMRLREGLKENGRAVGQELRRAGVPVKLIVTAA